jgi:hypothetical protein
MEQLSRRSSLQALSAEMAALLSGLSREMRFRKPTMGGVRTGLKPQAAIQKLETQECRGAYRADHAETMVVPHSERR